MATELPATQGLALKSLLIEDNPHDAAWTASMLKRQFPQSEVVQSTSLTDGLSVLAQRRIDVVFIGVHPDGRGAFIEDCRELVRRAKGKPVVAMVNPVEMEHADAIHASGVHSIYCKYARWAAQAGLPPSSLSRSWRRSDAFTNPAEDCERRPPLRGDSLGVDQAMAEERRPATHSVTPFSLAGLVQRLPVWRAANLLRRSLHRALDGAPGP